MRNLVDAKSFRMAIVAFCVTGVAVCGHNWMREATCQL
jgi:hypothetical protein